MNKVGLYDTVVRSRDHKWFRVVKLDEGGRIGLKSCEFGEALCRSKSRKLIYVTEAQLEKNFKLMDYPPVKTYIDESLIKRADSAGADREKKGAKEAYAARLDGVARANRRKRR